MTLEAVAFVPGSPLALPSISHAQYADHRDEVRSLQAATAAAVGACLEDAEVVVVLASGAQPALLGARRVDLVGLGVPDVVADLPGHPLCEALAGGLGLDVGTGPGSVEGDVLALHAYGHQRPVVTIEVDHDTAPRVGADLADAIASRQEHVAVLVAADLTCTRDTTSPGYLVDDAISVEQEAVAAVRTRDVPGLLALTGRALQAGAPTWPSLVAGTALAAAAGIPTEGLSHMVARGVGHVVGAAAAERLDLPATR